MSHTLFEVSWEVANKVGGIHTVVSSKARTLVDRFGDDYVALGPMLLQDDTNSPAFEDESGFEDLKLACRQRGVTVRVGRWAVLGDPRVILVGFSGLFEKKDTILSGLWERYKVDSLLGEWDYVEPVVFGHASAIVIEEWYRLYTEPSGQGAVAQFHEWMTGSGLLQLRQSLPQVGTIFTTHATMLGRALSATGKPPAEALAGRTPAEMASEIGVSAKHSIEGTCAREADVFTTVSGITAAEAELLHARRPDPLLPNGLDLEWIQELASRPGPAEARKRLEAVVEAVTGEPVGDAALICTSGRYEFHNKGIDVLLDALAMMEGSEGRNVVLLALVPAGTAGLRRALRGRLAGTEATEGSIGRLTHELFDPEGDPIRQRCIERGLNNASGSRVKVVHVPVYLPSSEPFDMEYEAALAACDLSCFASFYEPWGYTPPESIALGVPTVTTDCAGFGAWARERNLGDSDGVLLLDRVGKDLSQVARELATMLEGAIDGAPPATHEACLTTSRQLSWASLIEPYIESFDRALEIGAARGLSSAPRNILPVAPTEVETSLAPRLMGFEVSARLPEVLRPLERIARNLWWTWHPEAESLFADLAPQLWKATAQNPVAVLRRVYVQDAKAKAEDPVYRERLEKVSAQLDAYLAEPPRELQHMGETVITTDRPIAYFCFEYGLHASIPIYSGGLGVLAGDHLKAASDVNLPLVAVGLFYRGGFMRQALTATGEQMAHEVNLDPVDLPIEPMRNADGSLVQVQVMMPEGRVLLRGFELTIGRVRLLLLDADHEENDPSDRRLTRRLYAGDHEDRLRQEIVLGRGGVKLLRAAGIDPGVVHLNEGHAGFATLERISGLVREEGLTFGEALEVVRASSVFTTHTPVPAGHDVFGEDLMRRYFADSANWIGLPWEKLMSLGSDAHGNGCFNMSYLCLSTSGFVNGVAKKHGEVSRDLLKDYWGGFLLSEVPVTSVTNGIHTPTWTRPGIARLLGAGNGSARPEHFAAAESVNPHALWEERCTARREMLDMVRNSVQESYVRRTDDPRVAARAMAGIREDALVIGFARRFATYKRATLVFQDEERLARLLNDADRPVHFVFAGKAHPRDRAGQDILQRVFELTRRTPFLGKVFFLEDYDLSSARLLNQGVDVWLNNPTRPLEASGTSGMKVAANGGLNLSILDGWWIEGCDGRNGWAIGTEERIYDDQPRQDQLDNQSLLHLLETEIVPLFFEREPDGFPRRWMERVTHALATLPALFSTDRMVEEYAERAYVPLAAEHTRMKMGGFQVARSRAARLRRLRRGFPNVCIVAARVGDLTELAGGDRVRVEMDVQLADLVAEDLCAELIVGHSTHGPDLAGATHVELEPTGEIHDGVQTFSGIFEVRTSGSYAYGLRVKAKIEGEGLRGSSSMMRWA